jgi:hypothetical protein
MCRAKMTAAKKEIFLAELAKTGNISASCKAADLARMTAYDHRAADEAFRAAWDEAIDIYIDSLEREADRRAVEGCTKKKFLKNGEPVIDPETGEQYVEREYSDTLLIFRLKALKPDKYRENQSIEHSGALSISFGGEEKLQDEND